MFFESSALHRRLANSNLHRPSSSLFDVLVYERLATLLIQAFPQGHFSMKESSVVVLDNGGGLLKAGFANQKGEPK
jgi:hypothetical protein